MTLDIERERGWFPGTFDQLEHVDQVRLIAHWRVRWEAQNPAPSAAPKSKPVKSPRR